MNKNISFLPVHFPLSCGVVTSTYDGQLGTREREKCFN